MMPLSNEAIQGLLAFGAGTLANNTGNYGQFGPAVGKGGLLGLQQYGEAQRTSLFAKRQDSDEKYRKFQMDDTIEQRRLERERAQAEADARARLFGFMNPQQPLTQSMPVQTQIEGMPLPAANIPPQGPQSGNAWNAGMPTMSGGNKPPMQNIAAPTVETIDRPMEDPATLRAMATQAMAANMPQEATFLIGLANRLEDQNTRTTEKNEKTFTDNQGIVRYFNTGEPVAKQQPKTPEGMQYDDDGKLIEIPGYVGMKSKIAKAGKTEINNQLFAPQAGVDASGKQVFFQPSKGGGPPTIVPGVTPDKAPTTDVENQAAGFYDRMTAAEANMAAVGDKGYPSALSAAAGALPGKLPERLAMTQEQQRYRQAQEDWVRSKLRKESGAVIAAEEMEAEIATYFPKYGDSPEVIKQKEQARKTAIESMKRSSGRAEPAGKKVKRTGLYQGKKVIEYDDGTVEYAQ